MKSISRSLTSMLSLSLAALDTVPSHIEPETRKRTLFGLSQGPSRHEEARTDRVLMCLCYLQFWIAKKRRSALRNRRASDARSAAGRPAKKTDGLVTADTNGTPSTPEESALPVFISGLKPSVCHVAAGRRTRFGTRNSLVVSAMLYLR